MEEHRSEPRMICADLVEIRWADTAGHDHVDTANLEDISISGACFQVETEIPIASEVRISFPTGEFAGVVRYCQYKEIGYYVGVEFDAESKWSEASFIPKHLLDPRTLVPKPQGNSDDESQKPQ